MHKLLRIIFTYKNISTLLINAALWHYLGTNNFNFWNKNNYTPGVLIEHI